MNGTLLWLRRSWWVGIVILAVYAYVFMRAMAWRWDWSWMLSVLGGGTLLASPALAGAATVVVLRQFPADARDVMSVGVRSWAPCLQITAAIWLHAAGAYLISGTVASALCAVYQADRKGLVLPLPVLVGLAALLAAAVLGVVVGLLVKSVWAVPLVVLGLFLGHRPTYWTTLPELFTLKQATGSAANSGYRPVVGHLAGTLMVNLLSACALLVVGAFLSAPPGLRKKRLLLVALALLVAVGVIFGWGWPTTYEPIPI